MASLNSLIPPAPQISVDMFTGTTEQMSQTLVDTTNAIIDTMVAPLRLAVDTVDTMAQTADTTYNAAVAAYKTALIVSKGESSKLGKAADNALTFRMKVMHIKNTIDDFMSTVEMYANELQEIVQSTQKHSIEWTTDKVNWLLGKINSVVSGALEWVKQKIAALEGKVERKAMETQKKIEERLQQVAEDKTNQIQENKKKKAEQDKFAQDSMK